MSTAEKLSNMTAAEWLEWERQQVERHEFYDGEVFCQAGGTHNHSLIGSNILGVLHEALCESDCQVYGSDMRISIESTGSYVDPDVSVVCPPVEGEANDVVSNPVLVAEVLSQSTADFDRGTKFGYCRQMPALKDYLVISHDQSRVEHYFRNEGELWALRDVDGLEEVLKLVSIPHMLAEAEIYGKVEFD